ncbi:hypothetical protein [Cylindrospermopsis raciborskii]|uniref:Gas vesicle protein n=2 Tax=Cylindrospermopsis raciborskii TaxID=77022 RepID=A0A1X4G886_9CYAN|nr:hypothetical protein [Cylindrospermopsis raciborskii]EFA73121.1 conserved hypothetical protein [Raphidiopsis brookii D9]MCZ2201663.1 hypothetical protein [Cylindrospermopsis raciborskii PAMP2012]MCZ2205036.1 hypothetical protein [Cylindrospermopsis raciborskii PAMP2011]NLQ06500.1 hypothetical protein [Cylindrospermopsis raciborskii MVCC19]OHY34407.1 hypothetical protein BCV64_06470 [Cylindrospermopsis raciborskii MVCC14]
MSQKDGFGSGFLLGTIVGGVVGGILGTVLASRRETVEREDGGNSDDLEVGKGGTRRKQMKSAISQDLAMETARRSLEDKIAQLNATIDDVREQLNSVNSSSPTSSQSSLIQE